MRTSTDVALGLQWQRYMEGYLANQRSSTGNRVCTARFDFLIGVVKTTVSLSEIKRPEHVLKLFIRFCIARGVVTYGLELMLVLFTITQ